MQVKQLAGLVCLMVLSAMGGLAQTTSTEGDTPVTVPKKYVSAEGLEHQISSPAVNQWIGVGKEIGIATREGLEAVVDVGQKFGTTQVGRFVMFMVAWHILGKQLLGVVLGIPIWISGIGLWLYSMRRFFWGVRIVSKRNADKSKEYATRVYEFKSNEARTAAGWAHAVALVGWCALWTVIVFA